MFVVKAPCGSLGVFKVRSPSRSDLVVILSAMVQIPATGCFITYCIHYDIFSRAQQRNTAQCELSERKLKINYVNSEARAVPHAAIPELE